jgi:hypothetical protein
MRGNYEALLSAVLTAVLTRLTLTLGVEPVRLVQSHAKLTAGAQCMPLCHLALLRSEKSSPGLKMAGSQSVRLKHASVLQPLMGCFEIRTRHAHDWLPSPKLHRSPEVPKLQLG